MLIDSLRSVFKISTLLSNQVYHVNVNVIQQRYVNYGASELWKSVFSVSNQGSKKGRGRGRGNSLKNNLNVGQRLGEGKIQMSWPGLNSRVLKESMPASISQIGENPEREKKLVEMREKLVRFRRSTTVPHDRGFSGSSINGKSIGPPNSYDEVDFSSFDTRIIEYKAMISHKSKLGKKKVCSCFAITGNRNGIVGFGLGTGRTATGAIRLAKIHASKNLIYIPRYEDRTLFHNFYEEYYYVKLYAEKKPMGYGITSHRIIKKVCELAGIKDLYAKLEGSRNPSNIVKAFISGLLNQKSYDDIATEKNCYVVEFSPEKKNFPVVIGKPKTQDKGNETVENSKSEYIDTTSMDSEILRDLNLYLFDNRIRHERKLKKPFYSEFPTYKTYCKLRERDKALKKSKIERAIYLSDEAAFQYPKLSKKKVDQSEVE